MRRAGACLALLILAVFPGGMASAATPTGWRFLAHDLISPTPQSKIVTVLTIGAKDQRLTLLAFVARSHFDDSRMICTFVVAGPAPKTSARYGGSCGLNSGSTAATTRAKPWEFVSSGPVIFGAVSSDVARLDAVNSAGKAVHVPLLNSPAGLGTSFRFFVLHTANTSSFVARDRAGTVLAQHG
jgi:hypothetical protein